MGKKGYYLEVEITGKAKVWIKSNENKSDKDLANMERIEMQAFYQKAEFHSDELVEWDVEEVKKIERDEFIDD